jgi:hypothetical protein
MDKQDFSRYTDITVVHPKELTNGNFLRVELIRSAPAQRSHPLASEPWPLFRPITLR